MDIDRYLESKGLELHLAPNMNVRTLCFFHEEEGKASEGRLYIKVDPDAEVPGLFFCHVCEESGSLNKIRRFFGDSLDSDSATAARKIPILNAAARYYHDNLDTDAVSYLTQERGLSPETIMKFQLGLSDGSLFDFLLLQDFKAEDIFATGLVRSREHKDFFESGMIIIPYFDQGHCVQLRGRDRTATKNKYKTPTGQTPLLYNTDTLLHADEVIVTEGEFDAMILEEHGIAAVGTPGTRTFKPEFGRFFEEIPRVYICFDVDRPDRKGHLAGKEGAERTATIIGAKARIVELPLLGKDDEIDVSDYFNRHGKSADDFKYLLRNASMGMLVTVQDAFNAWLDREGNPDLSGFKIGYETFDSIIAPGLLPGQVAVFLARTGTGKTIMMVNIIQRLIKMHPEIKILFVSLEQTRNEWFERARRLQGFYHPDEDPFNLNSDTINYYNKNLLIVDKNRVSPGELRECIHQSEDELKGKPDIVVVDYLGYYARGFRGEPYVRTSDAIMSLKEIGKDEDVVVFSPQQVNRGSSAGTDIKISDARESGVVEETADFLLSIMNEDATPGINDKKGEKKGSFTGDVKMVILKSRHGGMGTIIEVKFAPTSLAMVPMNDILFDDKYLTQAINEIEWRNSGEHIYAQVLERHRTGNRSF